MSETPLTLSINLQIIGPVKEKHAITFKANQTYDFHLIDRSGEKNLPSLFN